MEGIRELLVGLAVLCPGGERADSRRVAHTSSMQKEPRQAAMKPQIAWWSTAHRPRDFAQMGEITAAPI